VKASKACDGLTPEYDKKQQSALDLPQDHLPEITILISARTQLLLKISQQIDAIVDSWEFGDSVAANAAYAWLARGIVRRSSMVDPHGTIPLFRVSLFPVQFIDLPG
jgi:hypothetical protein